MFHNGIVAFLIGYQYTSIAMTYDYFEMNQFRPIINEVITVVILVSEDPLICEE